MRFVFALWLLSLSTATFSHHSIREYNWDAIQEMDAIVTRVRWSNPHIRLTVETESGDVWELEATDLVSLTRQGVPRNAIVAGMQVTLAGYPSTARERHMFVTNVLRPDGLEVLLRGSVRFLDYPGTPPRWSDRYVGGGDWIIDEEKILADQPDGIYRVWSTRLERDVEAVANPPLTESARAAFERFDPVVDNPTSQCDTVGMPSAMNGAGTVHPFEITQRGDDILIRLETRDMVRVIHMDPDATPESEAFTELGYSKGRWEGDTLVVNTTRIEEDSFNRLFSPLEGIPQSREMEVTERFTYRETEEAELVYDISVTDPGTLTESIAIDQFIVWGWQPGVEVQPFNCVTDE